MWGRSPSSLRCSLLPWARHSELAFFLLLYYRVMVTANCFRSLQSCRILFTHVPHTFLGR